MPRVESCPKNLTEIEKSRSRLACGVDTYGNNQYICLPNEEKTFLAEFCYDGVMGIVPKGNSFKLTAAKMVTLNILFI